MATVALPGGVVSLSAENADRLLATGNGDAGLLYIALLRHGGELAPARHALGWTQGRLDGAYAALQGANLVGPAPAEAGALRNDAPPEYMTRTWSPPWRGTGTLPLSSVRWSGSWEASSPPPT